MGTWRLDQVRLKTCHCDGREAFALRVSRKLRFHVREAETRKLRFHVREAETPRFQDGRDGFTPLLSVRNDLLWPIKRI